MNAKVLAAVPLVVSLVGSGVLVLLGPPQPVPSRVEALAPTGAGVAAHAAPRLR
jgi:hypothetical protein